MGERGRWGDGKPKTCAVRAVACGGSVERTAEPEGVPRVERSGATRYSNESCRAEHAERAASGGDGVRGRRGDKETRRQGEMR